MDEPEWLAVRFQEHRGHLQAVAYVGDGLLASLRSRWWIMGQAGLQSTINRRRLRAPLPRGRADG